MTIKEIVIRDLDLKPLPGEGGFYRETYRGSDQISCRQFSKNISGQRNLGTAIYYMVDEENFSALHRLKADEIFHYYVGSRVEIHLEKFESSLKTFIMGSDILNGHHVQVLVPAGAWQGLRLLNPTRDCWALLGTTMAVGFDFEDF